MSRPHLGSQGAMSTIPRAKDERNAVGQFRLDDDCSCSCYSYYYSYDQVAPTVLQLFLYMKFRTMMRQLKATVTWKIVKSSGISYRYRASSRSFKEKHDWKWKRKLTVTDSIKSKMLKGKEVYSRLFTIDSSFTLKLFNIAMEHDPFIDDVPWCTY